MNEITAAIKKKAEKKYPDEEFPRWGGYFENQQLTQFDREAYTCGGEDAIGFMLKFTEWKERKNYWADDYEEDGTTKRDCMRWSSNSANPEYLTTEQLLLKYMEETKL